MEIENKIYSIAEMRELAIFTADYCFMDAPCTVVGTLLLKAQARRKMFRLFFRLEDESKIIIRVIESEKRKMEKSARLRGLTLSAYLRKLGLGRNVLNRRLQIHHRCKTEVALCDIDGSQLAGKVINFTEKVFVNRFECRELSGFK